MKQVLTPVVEIVVQKSQFTLNWDLVQFTPPPQLKFGQDLALWVLTTPVYPPPQIEIGQDLALWVLTTPVYPPPKLKFGQDLALWVLPQFTPTPNWNWTGLGTLSFDYPSLPPTPQIEIWTGLGTLTLDYPSLPTPTRVSGSSYVETNFCISRGYLLVSHTCEKNCFNWVLENSCTTHTTHPYWIKCFHLSALM